MAEVHAGAAATKLGYRPGLDALRGVAVALVVVAHLWEQPWRFGGRVGVTMFLTLSGFLITKLLLEEQDRTGGVSRRGFYRRRAARLLPALPAVLAVCAYINHVHGHAIVRPLLASVFYVQNFTVPPADVVSHGSFDHLWSLALEEQFYLLWPAVFVAFSRGRLLRLAVWSVPVFLAVRLATLGTDVGHFGRGSGLLRVDALLAGCGLAIFVHRHGLPRLPRWSAVWAWVAILALSAGGMTVEGFSNTFGYTIVIGATCALLIAAIQRTSAPAPLVGLGKISYGVYLWHVPAMWLLWAHGPVVIVGATLWIAVVSYRFVEQPARVALSRSRSDLPQRREAVPLVANLEYA